MDYLRTLISLLKRVHLRTTFPRVNAYRLQAPNQDFGDDLDSGSQILRGEICSISTLRFNPVFTTPVLG